MILTDGTHLVSTESLEELDRFAIHKLGFKRSWLQLTGKIPHYDLTTARARRRALNAGAHWVPAREIIKRAFRFPES